MYYFKELLSKPYASSLAIISSLGRSYYSKKELLRIVETNDYLHETAKDFSPALDELQEN